MARQKKSKNNQALIYVRVTVNQKRVNISVKRKITLSLWNQKSQKAKGNSSEARQINQYLSQVQAQLFQCYQDLKFKGNLSTSKLIKANYLGEDVNSKSLQQLLMYLRTNDIFLNKLNYKFICDFSNFLFCYWPKGHPKAMSNNTVMKHIQRFRKIVTLGYHIEWLDRDPFVRWKTTNEKRERPFLTTNELSNIEISLLFNKRLERVRDLFVFSCYTGIAYSDIMNLTANNILKGIDGSNWIFTNRQKTKSQVQLPILDKAQELINKYLNHPITQVSKTLFPVITNEKLNQYLKEVAFYCGIKKNLTFHMARHTFATT